MQGALNGLVATDTELAQSAFNFYKVHPTTGESALVFMAMLPNVSDASDLLLMSLTVLKERVVAGKMTLPVAATLVWGCKSLGTGEGLWALAAKMGPGGSAVMTTLSNHWGGRASTTTTK